MGGVVGLCTPGVLERFGDEGFCVNVDVDVFWDG